MAANAVRRSRVPSRCPPDVSEATVEAYVRPLVERVAFALSTNEA